VEQETKIEMCFLAGAYVVSRNKPSVFGYVPGCVFQPRAWCCITVMIFLLVHVHHGSHDNQLLARCGPKEKQFLLVL